MYRPEKIGCTGEILQCKVKEERLAGVAFTEPFANCAVVRRAVFDRVIEDRGIRCKTCDRKFVYVALERTVVQQIARDVVEPDTLTLIVEQLCRFHRVTSVP